MFCPNCSNHLSNLSRKILHIFAFCWQISACLTGFFRPTFSSSAGTRGPDVQRCVINMNEDTCSCYKLKLFLTTLYSRCMHRNYGSVWNMRFRTCDVISVISACGKELQISKWKDKSGTFCRIACITDIAHEPTECQLVPFQHYDVRSFLEEVLVLKKQKQKLIFCLCPQVCHK